MFGVIDFHSDRYSVGNEEGEPARDVRVCAQKPLLVGQTTPTRTKSSVCAITSDGDAIRHRRGRKNPQTRIKRTINFDSGIWSGRSLACLSPVVGTCSQPLVAT